LSFKEFVEFKKQNDESNEELFERYLKWEGFPVQLHTKDLGLYETLVKDIFETIVFKDIVSRYSIRNAGLFHNIIHYVCDNIGKIFSAKRISDYLKSQHVKIGLSTVYDYLKYLTATFAVHCVRRYDVRGKRHLEISEKYYIGDLALRHALIGYRSNDIDAFLENIVYLELLRRGYEVFIGKNGEYEIDFIAENQHEKLYIQVCYLLSSKSVLERETRAFQGIEDNYPRIILSLDKEIFGETFEGIKRYNLASWLLAEKSD